MTDDFFETTDDFFEATEIIAQAFPIKRRTVVAWWIFYHLDATESGVPLPQDILGWIREAESNPIKYHNKLRKLYPNEYPDAPNPD